jgi:hypothetical protein
LDMAATSSSTSVMSSSNSNKLDPAKTASLL